MLRAPLRLGARAAYRGVRPTFTPSTVRAGLGLGPPAPCSFSFSSPVMTRSSSSPSSPTSAPSSPSPSPTPTAPSQPEQLATTSPRLQKYAPALHALSVKTGTPLPSLVLSFMVLHELTAIVPVVGLYYLLHWLGAGAGVVLWLGSLGGGGGDGDGDGRVKDAERTGGGDADGEGEGETRWHHTIQKWYDEGAARAERVGRRYGVLGYEKGSKVGDPSSAGAAGAVADAVGAYVLVKALLPLRIAVSIGAAPAFARFALNPIQRAWRRVLRR